MSEFEEAGAVLPKVYKRPSRTKLRLIEAAASTDPQTVLYQHTVLAQTVLPYRDPGAGVREWERVNGRVRVKVIAGEATDPRTGEFVPVGLPFGPKSRLIVMHINAEAVKTQSAVIDIEGSLTAFVRRNGLDPKGRNIRAVKDQLSRLSASSMRLGVVQEGGKSSTFQGQIISGFEIWDDRGDERQRSLWPQTIQLSAEYFHSLIEHAVPLDERAVLALSHSAMAMDVYAWLAQRLHRIKLADNVRVTWPLLHGQFGAEYERLRDFRRAFNVALRQVRTQYPTANIDVHEGGLTLWNSKPPVLKGLPRP